MIQKYHILKKITDHNHDKYITTPDCLFGAVKLTKNADVNKYKFSGYGSGFDSRGS